jgi:hypothetical protein
MDTKTGGKYLYNLDTFETKWVDEAMEAASRAYRLQAGGRRSSFRVGNDDDDDDEARSDEARSDEAGSPGVMRRNDRGDL